MNASRTLLAIAVVTATIPLMTPDAHALASFKDATSQVQVFCDMSSIQGRNDFRGPQYISAGTCTGMSSPPGRSGDGHSEFPDVARSTQIFAPAGWTAVGTYNATTKATSETITLPAPTIDQPAPPSRPYGRFSATMICTTDPWLDRMSRCTGFQITASGNLGILDAALRKSTRPFSSQSKPDQQQALIDAAQRAQTNRLGVTNPVKSNAALMAPQIAAPLANATQRSTTPLAVRVIPGPLPATYYQLDFDRKDALGQWQRVASVSVPAATVEGPAGYSGWHPPSAGSYRLHAFVVQPATGAPGEWRPFELTGIDSQAVTERAVTSQPAWGASTTQQKSLQSTVPMQPRPVPTFTPPSALGSR